MEEIVHVTPIGWELSRAIEPIHYLKAHRVYLLYRLDHKYTREFVAKVEETLVKEKIEVIKIPIEDTREFDSLLFNISRIIVLEYDKKNKIYLNISASGKVASAATLLAGTYHSQKITSIYYVLPSGYAILEKNPKKAFEKSGFTTGMAHMYYLPQFQIESPSVDAQHLLVALYEKGPLSFMDLLKILIDKKIKPFDLCELDLVALNSERHTKQKEINRWIAKLRRLHLDKLIEKGYVELKPSYEGPKRNVEITPNGRYAAILSGLLTQL